jgi:hypothetical protein
VDSKRVREMTEWHDLNCGEEEGVCVTQGMNVAGGCLVRTIIKSSAHAPTGVAQTFVPGMHVESSMGKYGREYVLSTGVEIP